MSQSNSKASSSKNTMGSAAPRTSAMSNQALAGASKPTGRIAQMAYQDHRGAIIDTAGVMDDQAPEDLLQKILSGFDEARLKNEEARLKNDELEKMVVDAFARSANRVVGSSPIIATGVASQNADGFSMTPGVTVATEAEDVEEELAGTTSGGVSKKRKQNSTRGRSAKIVEIESSEESHSEDEESEFEDQRTKKQKTGKSEQQVLVVTKTKPLPKWTLQPAAGLPMVG